MSVSGKIEDFSVIDILQYIHSSKKTGILTLTSGDTESKIYLHAGNIIRAEHPDSRNLGEILLSNKVITSSQLIEGVEAQKKQKVKKPLGRILEEKRFIRQIDLQEALLHQIEDIVSKLLAWERGTFEFEPSEHRSVDGIVTAPTDLLLPAESNTQMVLLDASRRFDEARKNQTKSHDLPMPEMSEEILTSEDEKLLADQEMLESIRLTFPMLKLMLREIGKNMNGHDITLQYINILSECVSRAILFAKKGNQLIGIGGFGKTSSNASLQDIARKCRFRLSDQEVPFQSIRMKKMFTGPSPEEGWLKELHKIIGKPTRDGIVLLPVIGVDQFVCLVYGDNGKTDAPLRALDLLEIASGQTGLIIENNFLRNQAKRKSLR